MVRRLNAAIEEAYQWLDEGNHAALLIALATLLALASNLSPGTFGAETAVGDALAVAIHQLRATERGSITSKAGDRPRGRMRLRSNLAPAISRPGL